MRRKVKIIATLGPASRHLLKELVQVGTNVIRLNASHSDAASLCDAVASIRNVSRELAQPVAILVDLGGPKVRTRRLEGGQPVKLETGSRIRIDSRVEEGNAQVIGCTYQHLAKDLAPGARVLLDDGLIELVVESVAKDTVTCLVRVGGTLKERKGINCPDTALAIPALTKKDREDLALAAELGVDYIALSFVQRAQDVTDLRNALRVLREDIPIVAKIEKPQAMEDLDGILAVSDAVMVARGDLGVEMGAHRVPMLQKEIIRRSSHRGVLDITATQMLESMLTQATPTRAEVSDVANAILDGTHAVMLSGETAVGQHPLAAVAMMDRIAKDVEGCRQREPVDDFDLGDSPAAAVAHAACTIARDPRYRAIIVLTGSGWTARAVSAFTPQAEIFALTPSEKTYQQLSLARGVHPLYLPFGGSTDSILLAGERLLLQEKLLQPGDEAILVSGQLDSWGVTHMLKLFSVRQRDDEDQERSPQVATTRIMPSLDLEGP